MRKKELIALSVVWTFLASNLFAGGPAYSGFGLGNLYYFGGSRSSAMGGTAIGLIGDGFINRLNPAGLARISYTRFSGTFEYSNYSSTDNSGTAPYARGDFGGAAIAIPVDREYGIVIVSEMTPYSSVNYAIERHDSQYGISSDQQFFGSGGISQFSLGSSVSITEKLHAGVKLNYLAGKSVQIAKLIFTDNSYENGDYEHNIHYAGATFTVGAMYEGISDFLGTSWLKPLVLGAIVQTPANLDVREEHFASSTATFDTTLIRYGTASIPRLLAFGASYTVANRYTVAADIAMQDWRSAQFFGSHPQELRNSSRYSFGFEARPDKDADTFLTHLIYRAGFYYYSSYYQINNQGIDGIFLTAGVGLPIGPDSHLNVGLEYGTNGTTNNNLQKDKIFRLSVAISGSEAWFLRTVEE